MRFAEDLWPLAHNCIQRTNAEAAPGIKQWVLNTVSTVLFASASGYPVLDNKYPTPTYVVKLRESSLPL
jgi:hypothetical protein